MERRLRNRSVNIIPSQDGQLRTLTSVHQSASGHILQRLSTRPTSDAYQRFRIYSAGDANLSLGEFDLDHSQCCPALCSPLDRAGSLANASVTRTGSKLTASVFPAPSNPRWYCLRH